MACIWNIHRTIWKCVHVHMYTWDIHGMYHTCVHTHRHCMSNMLCAKGTQMMNTLNLKETLHGGGLRPGIMFELRANTWFIS